METFDFVTTKTITNQYSVPIEDLKEILEDNDMNYEDMSRDEIANFISDNEYEFGDFTEAEVEYSDTEVEVF